MKIEILIGSPRKKGNTFMMANALILKLPNKISSTNIEYLYEYIIEPCTDCRGCKKGELTCVQEDEMNNIYNRIESADIIIIGTPIYWYGPTAKTKLFIDRLRPYFVNKKLIGKKAALLLPAAEGERDCDLTIDMFQRIFQTLGIQYLGALTAKAYNIGDFSLDGEALASIENLTDAILSN